MQYTTKMFKSTNANRKVTSYKLALKRRAGMTVFFYFGVLLYKYLFIWQNVDIFSRIFILLKHERPKKDNY